MQSLSAIKINGKEYKYYIGGELVQAHEFCKELLKRKSGKDVTPDTVQEGRAPCGNMRIRRWEGEEARAS